MVPKIYWPNQFNHLVPTQPNVGSIWNYDGLMVKALVIEKLVRNSSINKEIMSEEYYQQKLKKAVESYNNIRETCNLMDKNHQNQIKQLNMKKQELTQCWLTENEIQQQKIEKKRKEILELQCQIRRIRAIELE